MTQEFAELLNYYNDEIEVYEGYSGRGMYGDTTTGVVCDGLNNILEAVSDIILGQDEQELNTMSAMSNSKSPELNREKNNCSGFKF